MKTRTALVLALCTLAANTSQAAVPTFITYSGRLTDGVAWSQSASLHLTFAVYAQVEGGQALWTSASLPVAVEDGYFSVVLGAGTDPQGQTVAVTAVFSATPETWLGVTVDDGNPGTLDEELKPRQPIGSVPYAARTEVASRGSEIGFVISTANGGLRVDSATGVSVYNDEINSQNNGVLYLGHRDTSNVNVNLLDIGLEIKECSGTATCICPSEKRPISGGCDCVPGAVYYCGPKGTTGWQTQCTGAGAAVRRTYVVCGRVK
jgi:hypothetical protein